MREEARAVEKGSSAERNVALAVLRLGRLALFAFVGLPPQFLPTMSSTRTYTQLDSYPRNALTSLCLVPLRPVFVPPRRLENPTHAPNLRRAPSDSRPLPRPWSRSTLESDPRVNLCPLDNPPPLRLPMRARAV